MFENFSNQFEGKFGKISAGMCRLSIDGGIAIKTSSGYKTYNVKTEKLTNVSHFCFDMGAADDMFFVIPTNRVHIGDIILVNGKPKCVIEAGKKTITVINYEDSTVENIIPTRHIMFGSSFFYGKIVSIFGNMFSKGKGLSSMMKMMMLSQMMGGNNSSSNNSNNNGFMGNMGQMMAMSMLMGKDSNPFDGMFDFDFDGLEAADEDDVEGAE